MTDPWRAEFWRIAGLLVFGLALGSLIGSVTLGLLLVLTAYLGWYLYNIWRLVRWLREGKKLLPPEASGIWDTVFEYIFRLQQRNRKRKKDLRRMLKRFHKITMALPDATVELRSGSEEIEWWNHAASKNLGFRYPRDSGQRISNLLRHPDFLQYLRGGNYDGAVEIPSPEDENRTLLVRVISYSGGSRLVIARDMTRVQMLERTRQDFIANVSHELRSPLTVISGYLETFLDDPELTAQCGSQLHTMQVQAQRMNRIVEDLLTLSLLESGTAASGPEAVPVPRLIETIAHQAHDLAGDDVQTISMDVDADLCIEGRESEIYSALSNLVFNAVRYTPAGGWISIRWQDTDSGPEFSVEDSGMGIAPQHLPRITERFYRVDAGRSRVRGGTGLGLAIVKHVLLRHRARLEIDSEPGQGSIFRCHFLPELRTDCSRQGGNAPEE